MQIPPNLALSVHPAGPDDARVTLRVGLGCGLHDTAPITRVRLRRRLVAGLQAVLEGRGRAGRTLRFALDAPGSVAVRLGGRGARWTATFVDRADHALGAAVETSLGEMADAVAGLLAELAPVPPPVARRAARLVQWAHALDAGYAMLDDATLAWPPPAARRTITAPRDLPVPGLRHLAWRRAWRHEAPGLLGVTRAGDILLVHDADGLCALERSEGRTRWHGSGLRPAPGPAGFALDDQDRLVAFRPSDGHLRWRTPLPREGLDRVLPAGDRVLMIGQRRRVYAVSAVDGRPAWRCATFHGAVTGCVVAGPLAWLAAEDGFVHALRTRDGRTRYRTPIEGEPAGPPALVAGGLIVALHHEDRLASSVACIDPPGGERRWTTTFDGQLAAPPTHDGRHIYVVVYDGEAAELRAIDPILGEVRWRQALGEAGDPPTVSASGDAVYLKHTDGRVTALDPRTGAARWRSTPDDPDRALSTNAPVHACRGLLLVPGTRLRALDPADGRVIHVLDCGELVPSWLHVWPEGDVAIAEDDAVARYRLGGHLALVA